jgi:hypothetical protein
VQSVIVILILKITEMLKIKYFIVCLMFCFLLLSCSKSVTYDITGDPGVKFFMNIPGPGNSPQNAINVGIVNIPNVAGEGLVNLSTTVPDTLKLPVFATKPVSQDVTIGAVLDTSLVAKYNATYKTHYKILPAGILKTDGMTAHIYAGKSTSTDSITITSDITSLNTLTGTSYMAPIRLTTVSNQSVGELASKSAEQVAYVIATVEQRRIKFNALATDALGALLTPRTSWIATFNSAPASPGSILDGSNTTYSRWAASPVQVDVDMQAAKNVTGIRLYTSNSSTYIPTQVLVYLSNDGINYDLIGSPLKANLTYATSYNYILFYKAIQARYVRLMLYYSTSTSTNNRRLAELDVYAN